MSVPAALHSRQSDEWWTPPEVFDPLNAEFGFNLDACAGCAEASRVPLGDTSCYLDPSEDGLTFYWSSLRNIGVEPVVWVNPPYSSTAKWIQKAWQECWNNGVTVVMLINNVTETTAWRVYIDARHAPYKGAAEVRFVDGRVYFIAGCDMAGLRKGERGPAPKGSAVVVFRPGHVGPPDYSRRFQQDPALVAARKAQGSVRSRRSA